MPAVKKYTIVGKQHVFQGVGGKCTHHSGFCKQLPMEKLGEIHVDLPQTNSNYVLTYGRYIGKSAKFHDTQYQICIKCGAINRWVGERGITAPIWIPGESVYK